MLGKLIRHEWKSVWKIPTLLIAALFVMAVVSGLTTFTPVFQTTFAPFGENVGGTVLQILAALLIIAFFLMLAACSIGIFLYLAVHFYKKMYSDEGYLTHTLPVTMHQILLSKIFVMVCWSVLNVLAVAGSCLLFAFMVIWGTGELTLADLEWIWAAIREFVSHIEWMDVVSFLLSGILSVLYSVLLIVGALSVGHLASRHKILLSIAAFFGISMVFSAIANVAQLFWLEDWILSNGGAFSGLTTSVSVLNLMLGVTNTSNVLMAAGCAALYFGSEYVNRRKLNLE